MSCTPLPAGAGYPVRRMRGQIFASVTWLVVLLAPSVAGAQAAPQDRDRIGQVSLFGEEEFTIQAATKTEIPLSRAPGSVTVISAEQIRQSTARTIPELLRLVAGVNVRWNPMVQTIDMRGFGQNPFTSRVLLLIDGVPYNSWNKGGFPQHPGLDFFVLQNVKRIEVVRGPGSSLYGENAYWGVVNIVTLSGEDMEGGSIEYFGGDLETNTIGAMYGQKVGEGSFLLSGKYLESQIPVSFWFREQDSRVESGDIYLKGAYKGFQVSYYRHEDEMDGFVTRAGPPGTTFRSAETIEQTVNIFALKYDQKFANGKYSFGADASFSDRDGVRCAACHALAQNEEVFSQTVDHGFQLIGDFRVGFHGIRGHDILLGVEAREVDTGDHTDEFLQPFETTQEVVFDYDKIAAYAQDQISLAGDRLQLVLGARYDGSNDLFDSEVSPRVALVGTPSESLVLRAGWSSSFRFPNFTELYENVWFVGAETPAFAFPLSEFVPNPGLEPEENRTTDLGLEYRFNPSLSAKVDLFYSEIKDFMVLAFIDEGLRIENHPDEASIVGSLVEFRWNVAERYNGFVNWSYQDQDQDGTLTDSSGKPFEFVYSPENKFSVGAFFGPFAGFRATIEGEWKDDFQGPSFWNMIVNDDPGVATLPSYSLVNVRLSYDLPFLATRTGRRPRISLYGKDLLDEEPVETLIPLDLRLPGRRFYWSLDFGF